ncbi:MAG: glycine zipper domain-containing protein [Burkholderia gladioli]
MLGAGLAALDAVDIATSNASAAEKKTAFAGLGGSLAGSAGGAAIGALVGSVVPVVGTAIGGVVGGLLGGWAGEALGKRAGKAVLADKAPFATQTRQRADKAAAAAAVVPAAKAVAPAKPPEIKVEYKPNVTIMGDPIPGTFEKFDAMLREHRSTLEKMIRDIVAAQTRVSLQGGTDHGALDPKFGTGLAGRPIRQCASLGRSVRHRGVAHQHGRAPARLARRCDIRLDHLFRGQRDAYCRAVCRACLDRR